jgi:sodium pump decarboxylase gamma subunit
MDYIMILQGLVVLLVGFSMVFAFLLLLILVVTAAGKIIPRFNHLLPEGESKAKSKKSGHSKASSSSHEATAAIAVAIAAAIDEKKHP